MTLREPTRQPIVLGWAAGYRRDWVRADLVAGLTTAAVVIPKTMAYATVAGLPVVMGLGAAFVPAILYALVGSSRPLSVSTTSAIAILTAAVLAATGVTDPARLAAAAVVLAGLVGAVLLVAGVLRLGFLGNFMSDPVLTGFKAGIGLVIIADQLPKLLGLHLGRAPFFERLGAIAGHLPETNGTTLLVALATLGGMLVLDRAAPRIPAPLVAVVLGIAASGLLHLGRAGVEVVGAIPSGLPVPVLPELSLVPMLWSGALGIALMASTETIAAGRSFVRAGDPRPGADRELVALGLANLGGSLFGGMAAGGGTSQTAVNFKAGARSQVASLVTVGVVGATLLVLAPLVGLMPQATLAAVVVVTTFGLLSPGEFRAIAAVRGAEFRWALVALGGVVLLGTLNGILLAVAISVLSLMWQANHPRVYALRRKPGTDVFRPASAEHPTDESIPGMLIVRSEGRMTFASAPRAGEQLWALIRAEQPRVVLLDCGAIPDFEYTALRMLENLERTLGSSGISLWLAALNPEVLRVVERSGLGQRLGRERMFFTVEHAVQAHQARALEGIAR